MKQEEEILLSTPDYLLNPHARARKHQLQASIAKRREVKQPLLADPSEKPGPRQSTSLASDQQNQFDKNDQARRQALAASNTQGQREAKRQEQHERWTGQSATLTTASGVKLDAKTAELKKQSDASRAAVKQPARTINLSTLYACVWAVMQTYAVDFFNSEFNAEALNRLVQKQLKNGAEVCPETIKAAYQEGLASNNFEQRYRRDPVTGGRISTRGASLHPPTMPSAVVWPDEEALLEREAQAEALQLGSEEAQRALKMTFEELQREVRKDFKRGGNEDVR